VDPVHKVNILLVDDQPGKLLSYQVILEELGENLLVANSAQEAFDHLNRADIAVVLVDVFMPDLDGFELARMIREHPRFQRTAIILISAVLLTDVDFLRGYQHGAVDYISVPVIPEILRAKVKVFADLYRKTQQLEQFNQQLEQRVAERTAALQSSTAELRKSEERLRLALDAAQMGWWDYDVAANRVTWSPSLVRIMGFSPESFGATFEGALDHVHPEDRQKFLGLVRQGISEGRDDTCEIRFVRPDGSVRWSLAAGQVIRDAGGGVTHFVGVDLDITERKQAEDRQGLLLRELDHRAKNLLAVIQSIVRLSRAPTIGEFVAAVEGRILALSRAHTLLSETRWASVDLKRLVDEEMAPFTSGQQANLVVDGPPIALTPAMAQPVAMVLHELLTNAVKYGALSVPHGRINLDWAFEGDSLVLRWIESGGPPAKAPKKSGFGISVISASLQNFSGNVIFEWRPDGLRCDIRIPRGNFGARKFPGSGQEEIVLSNAVAKSIPIDGGTILLLEDEALVGALIKDLLSGIGYTVIGPISEIGLGTAAARDKELSAAILDINLDGALSYPVAEILTKRQIPFVFLTGYNTGAIDPSYAHIPVLQKPIDADALKALFHRVDPVLSVTEPEIQIPILVQSARS